MAAGCWRIRTSTTLHYFTENHKKNIISIVVIMLTMITVSSRKSGAEYQSTTSGIQTCVSIRLIEHQFPVDGLQFHIRINHCCVSCSSRGRMLASRRTKRGRTVHQGRGLRSRPVLRAWAQVWGEILSGVTFQEKALQWVIDEHMLFRPDLRLLSIFDLHAA